MLYDVMSSCRNTLLHISGLSSNSKIQQSLVARWPGRSPRSIILPTYVFLLIVGFYTTWYQGSRNGLFDHLSGLVLQTNPELPGSYMPLVTRWTGLASIDTEIARFVTFCAPIVDGAWPALSMLGLFGVGQLCAMWTLLLLEARRKGNERSWFKFIGQYGFVFQNIFFSITAPIFFLSHLLSSSVARQFPGAFATTVLHVPASELYMLPLSVTLGFIVPTLLAALPYPSYVSPMHHQFFIACWPLFPINTIICHKLLTWGYSSVENRVKYSDQAPAPLAASYLRSVRPVYIFVMAICILTNLPIYALTFFPSTLVSTPVTHHEQGLHQAPTMWNAVGELTKIPFHGVFIPPFPSSHNAAAQGENHLSVLATNVQAFLQWHIYVTCLTCLVWGIYLHNNATSESCSETNGALPKYRELLSGDREEETMRRWRLVGKVVGWTAVGGPMGALTMLLWDRDHIVRQKIKQGI